MTKDEQIANLMEMNAWLRSRIEILEAVRPLSSTERSRMCRQRQRTEMQRECNGNATPNVAELSTNATKVQRDATKCNDIALPEYEKGGNGPLGGSHTLPVTPLNPPKARELCATAEQFDRFWAAYPRSENGSKARAREAWKKLSPEEGEAAVVGAGNYAQSDRVGRGVVMHPTTWLHGRNWEEWQEAPSSAGEVSQDVYRQQLLQSLLAQGLAEDEALLRAGLRPVEERDRLRATA